MRQFGSVYLKLRKAEGRTRGMKRRESHEKMEEEEVEKETHKFCFGSYRTAWYQ